MIEKEETHQEGATNNISTGIIILETIIIDIQTTDPFKSLSMLRDSTNAALSTEITGTNTNRQGHLTTLTDMKKMIMCHTIKNRSSLMLKTQVI